MTSNKLLVAVALLAAFSLVSCGEKKKEENKATEAPAAPAEVPAAPAPVAPPAAPAEVPAVPAPATPAEAPK